jgi:hypothetical protein
VIEITLFLLFPLKRSSEKAQTFIASLNSDSLSRFIGEKISWSFRERERERKREKERV